MDSEKTCGCCSSDEKKCNEESKIDEQAATDNNDVVLSKKDFEKLLESKNEADKAKKELVYFQAELENFKRRQQKVTSDQVCYANEKFIRELIPVIDNFSLALKHIDGLNNTDNKELKNLVKGVELITKQFSEVLGTFGVEEVKCEGNQFDPNFHDAVEHREVDDCESGSIVSQFQKGYMLNGRLIRPAKVCVAKNNKEQK